MRYGDKRWIDIDAMDKDRVVVVCPIGSLEQHGHHLPLLTDTYLVTEVAERIERKLSDKVLLTPTLWLGASDHHLDFPGTVSVPNSFYVGMVKNIVRSFVKHGFRRVVFLNGHGGNIAPGEVAVTEMAHSHDDSDDTMVVFANYWALAGDGFAPEKHGMQTPEVTHACEYETSMMQAVRDDLVHLEDAKAGEPIIDSPFYHSEHGGRVSLASRFHRLTPTGAMGHPEFATPEKGESLLSSAAEEVIAFIEDFLTWTQPRVLKP